MDGQFYVDQRQPFIAADAASVTLASTLKAMVPLANLPILGSNYFGWIGKAVRIRMFGRITTAATPGNGLIQFNWGTGADANGTAIMASAAHALTASQTNLSFQVDVTIRCRSTGATGTLFGTGVIFYNNAVVANTLQPVMIPASAPAASASLDLTAANVISPQYSRSGSTAETLQVHEYIFEALN